MAIAADIAAQLDRLGQVSDACAESPAGFLLELLTPYSDARRRPQSSRRANSRSTSVQRLVVDAITQIQDAGVAADVWKVEGVADAAVARRSPQRPAAAAATTPAWWFSAPAPASTLSIGGWRRRLPAGYSGFAVGRSIWADAVLAHDRGELERRAARAQIADRYGSFIDTFHAAR